MNSVSTQCTNQSNVELLLDAKIWNSTILYRLKNENFTVGCRKCNTDSGQPRWLRLDQTPIQRCNNASESLLCTQTNGSVEVLKFSSFNISLAGDYQCDSNMTIRIKLGELLYVSILRII